MWKDVTSLGGVVTFCEVSREGVALRAEVEIDCKIIKVVSSFKCLGSCVSVEEGLQEDVKLRIDDWLKNFDLMEEKCNVMTAILNAGKLYGKVVGANSYMEIERGVWCMKIFEIKDLRRECEVTMFDKMSN